MKSMTVLLSALLILTLAGCASDGAQSESSQASQPPSSQEAEASAESGEASEEASEESVPDAVDSTSYSASSDYLEMTLSLGKEVYDLDSVVDTTLVITNTSDKRLVYVKGSGSNYAPDALVYTIGEFTPMYRPGPAVTMDYRTDVLNPGEKLELELNFAPYIQKDPTKPVGNDKDIEFFKTDDFTPVEPGVYTGRAAFECRVVPDDTAEDAVFAGIDGFELTDITIEFEVSVQ